MESISTGESSEYLLLRDAHTVRGDSCLQPAHVFRIYLHYCQFRKGKCDMIAMININMYSRDLVLSIKTVQINALVLYCTRNCDCSILITITLAILTNIKKKMHY